VIKNRGKNYMENMLVAPKDKDASENEAFFLKP
jgi:hypothetical protein